MTSKLTFLNRLEIGQIAWGGLLKGGHLRQRGKEGRWAVGAVTGADRRIMAEGLQMQEMRPKWQPVRNRN